MKLARVLFVLLLTAMLAPAQNPRPDNLSIFRPVVYAIEKQMDRVLALTADQETRVTEAWVAWETDAEVEARKTAYKALEGQEGPEVGDAKQALDTAHREAEERFRAVVDETLSAEQKQLVAAVNGWAEEINQEIKEGDGGWNERMERIREEGQNRLKDVLTPAQIELLGG